jgi:hypothetical protein
MDTHRPPPPNTSDSSPVEELSEKDFLDDGPPAPHARHDTEIEVALLRAYVLELRHLLYAVASPAYFAHLSRLESPEVVHFNVVEFVAKAVQHSHSLPDTLEARHVQGLIPGLRRLRDLLDEWTPAVTLPHSIRHQARQCLAAWGCVEPTVGWDSYIPSDAPSV